MTRHRWLFVLPALLAIPFPRTAVAQRAKQGEIVPIYIAAMRAFSPPWGQQRWLSPQYLQEPGVSGSDSLPGEVFRAVLSSLGRRFHPLGTAAPDPTGNGGLVMLGTVHYHRGDSVSVRTQYRHVTPYATHPPILRTLTLTRGIDGWRVAEK